MEGVLGGMLRYSLEMYGGHSEVFFRALLVDTKETITQANLNIYAALCQPGLL